MSKSMRRYLVYGSIFCLAAVLFVLLYHFKVIKNLSLLLTVVYVAYFVGMAFFFNCAYCKKHLHTTSAWINGICGGVFVVGAIVMLIIGLTNGQIQF